MEFESSMVNRSSVSNFLYVWFYRSEFHFVFEELFDHVHAFSQRWTSVVALTKYNEPTHMKPKECCPIRIQITIPHNMLQ